MKRPKTPVRTVQMESVVYSIYKASEGGLGRRAALESLADVGIRASKDYSPYIGQEGVRVYGGKRVQKKAEKILFGY